MGAAVVTFDRVENPDFDFVDVSTSRALALVASSSIEDSVGDGTISTDMVDLEDRTDDELRDKALLKDERRAASPMLLLLTELILMEVVLSNIVYVKLKSPVSKSRTLNIEH